MQARRSTPHSARRKAQLNHDFRPSGKSTRCVECSAARLGLRNAPCARLLLSQETLRGQMSELRVVPCQRRFFGLSLRTFHGRHKRLVTPIGLTLRLLTGRKTFTDLDFRPARPARSPHFSAIAGLLSTSSAIPRIADYPAQNSILLPCNHVSFQ